MYHLKNFFRLNKIVYAVYIVFIALLFVGIAGPVFHRSNAARSLAESAFVESGYLNGLLPENTYYADMAMFSCSANGQTLFCDALMTDNGIEYGGNYFTKNGGADIPDARLQSGECAVSKATLKEYGLQIGDTVAVRSNFVDYSFTVKYAFDDYYGLSAVSGSSYRYLVIFGYNEGFVQNLFSYSYYHFSDEYSTPFARAPIFDKARTVGSLERSANLLMLAGAAAAVLFTVLVETLFANSLRNDVSVYARSGYRRREILLYMVIDTLYKYIPAYAVAAGAVAVFAAAALAAEWLLFIAPLIASACSLAAAFAIQVIRCRKWLK